MTETFVNAMAVNKEEKILLSEFFPQFGLPPKIVDLSNVRGFEIRHRQIVGNFVSLCCGSKF